MEVEVGKSVENLPTPTLDGWNFISWYTLEEFEEVSAGAPIIIKNNYVFEEDTTLYAYFQRLELGIAEATVTFDLSHCWPGASCDEDEKTVIIGLPIGTLPIPTLDGWTFKGWYTQEEINKIYAGETGTRVKTTFVIEGDITLYPYFIEDAQSESSETIPPCVDGARNHSWSSPTMIEANCTSAGKKSQACNICGAVQYDNGYESLNPALGHDYGEWKAIPLKLERECEREGCGEKETQILEDITSNATVTVDGDHWGYSSGLTDGVWEGMLTAVSPKGTGPFTITILFNEPTIVDQFALSVSSQSLFKVYYWYEDEATFRDEYEDSGAFIRTTNTKETALCLSLMDKSALNGIKIVVATPTNGQDYFYELAVGKIKEN
jgi:hypothetical protein